MRIPIKATAHVPIKQAGYISATSAFHAQSLLRNAAGPYIGATTGLMHCNTGVYSITSSARASSASGTSRPRPLAVLRLMMSSNLVGCCPRVVGGLCAFEDLVDIGSTATPAFRKVRPIAHQSAGFNVLPVGSQHQQRTFIRSHYPRGQVVAEER